MDNSMFHTPSTCTAAYVSDKRSLCIALMVISPFLIRYFADMNMRSVLTGVTFPAAWTQLQLINDNLDSVPDALSDLSLTYLYVLPQFQLPKWP